MKQQINEIKRMQQLAGLIKEDFTKRTYKRPSNAAISVRIETPEGDIINVRIKARVTIESGAFDYNYGDIRGTHDPGDEAYVEDIEWNKAEFDEEENKTIDAYIDENYEKITDNLVEDYINSQKNNY